MNIIEWVKSLLFPVSYPEPEVIQPASPPDEVKKSRYYTDPEPEVTQPTSPPDEVKKKKKPAVKKKKASAKKSKETKGVGLYHGKEPR